MKPRVFLSHSKGGREGDRQIEAPPAQDSCYKKDLLDFGFTRDYKTLTLGESY